MSTETVSPRYAALDLWPLEDAAAALADSQLAAAALTRAAAPQIARAAEAAAGRLTDQAGRLIYVGAGASGRLGVQDGVELHPTFGWPHARLLYFMAGGERALIRSAEGAEDDRAAADGAVENAALGPADVLIAIAASGRTPYALAAVEAARARGALTIGLCNNAGVPLADAAEFGLTLDTGAEVVAGSTRMAAGTAQKIALNMLSTLIMLRLGRLHGNLMVDLSSTNQKLDKRRVEIVVRIADCDAEAARAALTRCGDRIKPAALMLMRGLSPEAANKELERAGGVLRRALDMTGDDE